MFKLLLVDDEPEIREGLQEVVDFASLGFEVVGEAGNGLDALRLCESLQPDLIITDIRMPLMDGLTMAAEVKKVLPTAQFVILSGYDEFEYARQAIEITALRYILKPISAAEFVAMMEDVRAMLDDAFEKRRDLTNLRAHFRSSLPILRETLLASLQAGGTDARAALVSAQRYEMSLESPGYALALLRLPEADEPMAQGSIDDPELLALAIRNIAEEALAGYVPAYLFHHNDMLAALLLLPGDAGEAQSVALRALEDTRQNIAHFLNCRISMGVSAPSDSLSSLPNCARQALSALHHAVSLGGGQVLCITDTVPGSGRSLAIDEYTLRTLGNHLKTGDVAKARQAIRALLSADRVGQAPLPEYRAYLLEMLMVFIRTARDLGLSDTDEAAQEAVEQLMGGYPPLPRATHLFLRLANHFSRSMRENRATSARLLAQRAVEYLRQHYGEEDVSINKLCEHLHISISYFSALFKRETQKTFLQYLTELRMDKAMTLLVTSDLRTSDIAERVGFGDPSYFSYSFKKHFGFSPSHARRTKEGAP